MSDEYEHIEVYGFKRNIHSVKNYIFLTQNPISHMR